MKKLLLSIALIALIQFASAIEPITKFYCSAFDAINSEFVIEATPIYENGTFNLDVPIMSFKGENNEIYLRIPSKKIPKFVAELQAAKEIYIRWTNAAKENNISELALKEMDIKPATYEARFLHGDWHFAYRATPAYAFKVDKTGHTLVIALTRIQSSSNQFVKNDGGILWFNSVEEIDAFIKCIDPQLVEDHYANKKSVESVFN